MTRCESLGECARGSIAEMLVEAYAPLLEELPEKKRVELVADWRLYDAAVHDAADTVGAAGFLTLVDGSIIGFGSWDPRGWPDVGLLGHNCIRPGYQRRGFGRQQVEGILRIFRDKGFYLARIRTDAHPFFLPARRIYEACGFREMGREPGGLLDTCDTVIYERELKA